MSVNIAQPETQRPPFPTLFDSTMIGTFRACPRKFQYEFLNNLAPEGENVHLTAGAAFARGLEVVRKEYFDHERSADDALASGLNSLIREYGEFEPPEYAENKSWDRMAGALEYYFSEFPLATDTIRPIHTQQGHKIEYSFCLPFPGVHHPETGEEILYAGRCDMIGEMDGKTFITDEKTTGQLGSNWSKQWELRSQFTGYCWAAAEEGLTPAGVLIRGIALRKHGYDKAQALVYRPRWMIERWLEQTRRDILRLIECWREGYFDFNLDQSCSTYSGCPFLDLCSSGSPENWMSNYKERRWNPLGRNPTKAESIITI
jgi:hypothetical protein